MSLPVDDPDFYTAGYQGRDIDSFVGSLVQAGVETLIDIRFNPVSMYKPAFSRRNLEARLDAAGIDYLHMPELGVPSEVRRQAEASGCRDDIWEWYSEFVLPIFTDRNLDWFFNAANHPVAMMCVERDPEDCHRHRLAAALGRQGLASRDI